MKYKPFKIKTDEGTFCFLYTHSTPAQESVTGKRLLNFQCTEDLDYLLDNTDLLTTVKSLGRIYEDLTIKGFTDIVIDGDSGYEDSFVNIDINACRHETNNEAKQRLQEYQDAEARKKDAKVRKKKLAAESIKRKAEKKEKKERDLYKELHKKYGDE